MVIAQTQKAEEDLHVLFQSNLFLPSNGDVCFINKLPPELLSRIFEVGTAYDGYSEDGDDVVANFLDKEDGEDGKEETGVVAATSSDFPRIRPLFQIVASHVCRHWRNVALSTPYLWTVIVVTPVARPPYEFESTLLERSQDIPIDVSINCQLQYNCDFEGPSDSDLRFLFSMLISHIHRWRTIRFLAFEYHEMYEFLSAVSGPSIPAAPQLTTLELYYQENTGEFDSFVYPSMSKHLTLFGGSAPLLTRLVLSGVHVDWNQPWISCASNLTDLELAFHAEDIRPSWAQFATILRGASALKKLSLRLSGPSGDPAEWFIEPTPGSPADFNAPIPLPRVTGFVLAFHSQACAIGLLHKFHLPVLKNLVLSLDDDDDYTDFVHELARTATSLSPSEEQPRSLLSKLESLNIARLPCDIECVTTLYSGLQNLTSLQISLGFLPRCFLDILSTPCTLTGQGNIWLPQLATLRVSGTFGDALRKVVQKRKDVGVPLSSLYVERWCEVEKEDLKWLKENVKTFKVFEEM